VLVVNLSTGMLRQKTTNSSVGIVMVEEGSCKGVEFYIHCNDEAGLQSIVLLQLNSATGPLFTTVCEFKGSKTLSIENANSLIVLDVNYQVKKFKKIGNSVKLSFIDDFRILETARAALSEQDLISQLALTEEALYIQGSFYTLMKKSSKDNYQEFEQARDKVISSHLTDQNLSFGPIKSSDGNSLLYIYNHEQISESLLISESLAEIKKKKKDE
jgi:hypothetical protein